MSEGGWPSLTIDLRATVAGVSRTTVPSGMVTLSAAGFEVPVEVKAEVRTPAATMKTAIPRTMIAGVRKDMRS